MTGSPPLAADAPPLLPPEPNHKSGSLRNLFAILLSLCLGLFLVDTFASLLDDFLIVFLSLHTPR